MMVWKKFYGLSDYWDEALTYSEDYNVFQSYVWGEFKKTTGWVPERWIASDKNGDIICMVQILIKSFPAGFKIGWATGGPVFISKNSSTKDFDNMLSGLAETVCKNNSAIVTRFNSQLCYDQLASYTFNKYFKRPFFRLNSGYSLLFDLTLSVKELLNNMTSKHRYYVRKAVEKNVVWREGNDEKFVMEFCKLYEDMLKEKDIKSLILSKEDITSLVLSLDKNVVIFTGDFDDLPVTSCIVLTFKKKAFYYMAATNKRGREIMGSYAMVYRLFEYLKEKGITDLDLGGIDPVSSDARGVNHFKKGFGGRMVEYLGEWEQASSEWIRWAVNIAIRLKRGQL